MALDNMSTVLTERQDYSEQLFEGTVVNNADPQNKGRFQVSIPGILEEGELPWIGNVRESPFGQGNGYGSFGAPAVGSSVIVKFQGGDVKYGYKVGFAPKNNQVPSAFQSPNTWGYRDPSGNQLTVNQDAGTYTFTHSSGTTYTIAANGSLTADIKSNVNITINGNANITASGSTTVKANSATIDSPTTRITGQTTIEGLLRVMAGIIIQGDTGSGVSAEMYGNINHSNGIFRSNNVGVSTHIHNGPNGNTNSPTPGT